MIKYFIFFKIEYIKEKLIKHLIIHTYLSLIVD